MIPGIATSPAASMTVTPAGAVTSGPDGLDLAVLDQDRALGDRPLGHGQDRRVLDQNVAAGVKRRLAVLVELGRPRRRTEAPPAWRLGLRRPRALEPPAWSSVLASAASESRSWHLGLADSAASCDLARRLGIRAASRSCSASFVGWRLASAARPSAVPGVLVVGGLLGRLVLCFLIGAVRIAFVSAGWGVFVVVPARAPRPPKPPGGRPARRRRQAVGPRPPVTSSGPGPRA